MATPTPPAPAETSPEELPMEALVGRMIRTDHRVSFTDCDPYGHMASARYLELAVNHRMSAVTHQLGYDTLHTAKHGRFAFINKEVHLDFKRSAQFDDRLVVESWIEKVKGFRMTVKVRISDAESGKICCLVTILSVGLDPVDEIPVPIPRSFRPLPGVDPRSLPWAPGHPMEG